MMEAHQLFQRFGRIDPEQVIDGLSVLAMGCAGVGVGFGVAGVVGVGTVLTAVMVALFVAIHVGVGRRVV